MNIRHLAQGPHLNDKALRQIFVQLQSGQCEPEEALALRCEHFAMESFKSTSEPLARLWSKRLKAASEELRARGVAASYNPFDLGGNLTSSMASLMPMPAEIERMCADPGSLAAAGAPKALLEKFLMRRSRGDWASETRAASLSAMFKDPLVLGMLRRVAPERAAASLGLILMRACLALDPLACQDALALGADPLKAPALEAAWSGARAMPVNLLGSVMMRDPHHPLPIGQGLKTAQPNPLGDDHLYAAMGLAMACCAKDFIPALLSLAPLKAKALPPQDALGLSMTLGLYHCAARFMRMGMDLQAKSVGQIGDLTAGPSFHALRAQAFAQLRARAERESIQQSLPEGEDPAQDYARARL